MTKTRLKPARSAVLPKHNPAVNTLAYLISRYPAISHTFILREIQKLKELGWKISVASINASDRDRGKLSPREASEAASTFYVKRQGALGGLIAMAALMALRPFSFLRSLAFALSMSGMGPVSLIKSAGYFVEAAILGFWMRRQGTRHLHVHFGTSVSTVALIAARAWPITLSLTIHGPDEFDEVSHYLLRKKVEGSRFVCCIGYFARSQMMRLTDPSHWDRFHVAPLGVNLAEFSPRPFRAAPDVFELVCVGRLTPAKGQMILLQALKILHTGGFRVRCRLIGDGPSRRGLADFASRELDSAVVVFEGALNQDRVHEMLLQSDIFVLPSFAEGIPVSLMEAMSMEIPCVSTTVAGIPELIRNGTDGILVAPSSPQDLASGLALLIDDPSLRQRLGRAGRVRVSERFDLDRNVTTLSRILECELSKL